MRKPREISESGYYHLVNRGINQQVVFEDDFDYQKFLSYLGEAEDKNFAAPAWCLMGNHYHLIVRGELETIALKIGTLTSRYTKLFNRRHGRKGSLFDERFWSQPLNDDAYLLACIRYIHQNPAKAGISSPESYPYSSYKSFLRFPMSNEQQFILDILGGQKNFIEFHKLNTNDSFLEVKQSRANMSDMEAIALVLERFNADPATLTSAGELKTKNKILIYLRHDLRLSVEQMQRITGLSRSSIYRLSK